MNIGSISITGLIARDFNIQEVIAQLGQVRSKPIALLQARQEKDAQRLTAYQQLIAGTLSLSAAASALTDGTAFSQVTAGSANSAAVVASASAGAPVGSYEVVVTQLAQSHKLASASVASSSEALGYEGDLQVNGRTVSLTAEDSLTAVRDAINAAGAGVRASILTASADDHRLVIASLTSGAAGAIELTDPGSCGILDTLAMQEVDAAQDALFSIDGVAMSRSTNAVDDAIENVQLQLLQTTGADGVRVSIASNANATIAAVEGFVTACNRVMGFINANQSFDTDAETGGLFFGSPAIMNFESAVRDQISGLVATLGGDLKLPAQIGLTFDGADQLSLDSGKLRDALASDPEGVKRLFGTRTDTSGPAVEVVGYTSATRDSGAAGWEVLITQEATRATATSASLGSGITTDEILTINGKPVSLTAGMDLAAASDRLNALFTAQHLDLDAGVEGDRLVIRHTLYGSARSISITSSLGHGAGGTDLGGTAADEARVVRGLDVAGTIGGHEATGSGRLLSGRSGSPVAGLQLTVRAEAPGPAGVVRVSKGISARLTDLIAAVTDQRGSLTRAAEGVTGDIEAIDEQIAKIDADVDRYITKLQLDFAVMEAKMSQSLTLLDWMQNQMEYLPGSSRR